MKNIYYILTFILFGTAQVFAQASGEITTKGVVYPRYTDSNRPVAPLTIGTTIFNTSQNTHQYWNGSSWTNVSTPGSGGGPWSTVGNNIFNNNGNRVGINTANPNATLEVQGSSFALNQPYTITASPPTNTYTMPYNGFISPVTDDAGYILDPGGNGNFVSNTNYSGSVSLFMGNGTSNFRYKLTFESLDLGTDYNQHTIIISQSSDVNAKKFHLLEIKNRVDIAKLINSPLIFDGHNYNSLSVVETLFIHFVIKGGYTAGTGFKILFQKVNLVPNPNRSYTEIIGDGGIAYNDYTRSFAVGSSRAKGVYSSAFGISEAIGAYSFAGGSSSATGLYSTSFGDSFAWGDYSTAIGGSFATGDYSTAIGYGANTRYKTGSFAINGASSSVTNFADNDKDYQMKMHFNEYRFNIGESNDVTFEAGNITTNNTLQIFGAANRTISNYGYLSNTAPTGIYTGSVSVPYSIYASNRVMAQEFNAFSDARHKKLNSYSNGKRDLALLNQLKVSNYTFTDTVGKGGKMQLGFIAQEVEKIVPEAINKIQDYIPSIYDMANSITYDATARTLTVSTNKAHDFKAKDEIKLISLNKEHKVKVESIIDANTFVVANWEKNVDKLFVFGKRVDDFSTVDYYRLFTLGISSIQELSRKVEQLEQENRLLKAHKDEFSQIKSEVAELREELSRKVFREKPYEK